MQRVNAVRIIGLLISGLLLESARGQIFVTAGTGVKEFSLSGQVINSKFINDSTWGSSQVAVDANGNFYVTYLSGMKVEKYSPTGAVLNNSFASGYSPWGIAVSGNNVYVANDTTGSVALYDTSGNMINPLFISGLGSDRLQLALDGNGHLFVCKYSAGTIGEYTTSGGVVNASLIKGLDLPTGIAADSAGNLFISEDGDYRVAEYSASGSLLKASLISGLESPMDVALDGQGDLFVADSYTRTIGEYSTSGAVINASFISTGLGPIGLLVTETPEPSSMALLVFGAAGLTMVRTRRRGRG